MVLPKDQLLVRNKLPNVDYGRSRLPVEHHKGGLDWVGGTCPRANGKKGRLSLKELKSCCRRRNGFHGDQYNLSSLKRLFLCSLFSPFLATLLAVSRFFCRPEGEPEKRVDRDTTWWGGLCVWSLHMTTRTVDPFFSLFLIAEMVRFAFYAGKDICVCIAGSRMDIQIKVISTKKARRALPSVR